MMSYYNAPSCCATAIAPPAPTITAKREDEVNLGSRVESSLSVLAYVHAMPYCYCFYRFQATRSTSLIFPLFLSSSQTLAPPRRHSSILFHFLSSLFLFFCFSSYLVSFFTFKTFHQLSQSISLLPHTS